MACRENFRFLPEIQNVTLYEIVLKNTDLILNKFVIKGEIFLELIKICYFQTNQLVVCLWKFLLPKLPAPINTKPRRNKIAGSEIFILDRNKNKMKIKGKLTK